MMTGLPLSALHFQIPCPLHSSAVFTRSLWNRLLSCPPGGQRSYLQQQGNQYAVHAYYCKPFTYFRARPAWVRRDDLWAELG